MFAQPARSVYVAEAWSGTPVGFQITTHGDKQYVAFYDAQQRMMMGCRKLDSEKWTFHELDQRVGWDSHNAIAFAFDPEGHIHLSGNMHADSLVYYRNTRPEDITSFERIDRMTGEKEDRVTYPRFFHGPDGELLFAYRDGGSGAGDEIVNVYDPGTKKWARRVSKPLFEGGDRMNAYYAGPIRDADGDYHVAWVWRNTPDCLTNHDVSYARSKTYSENFTRSDGTSLKMPLTLENSEIVDPVPVESGLLNNVQISLDSQGRAMITYHKFDSNGHTQMYTARREDTGWRIYQTTDWDFRWEFGGCGSIPRGIVFSSPQPFGDGRLCQLLLNALESDVTMVRFLDEKTLQPTGEPVRLYSQEFDHPKTTHTDDWQVNISWFDLGKLITDKSIWVLRWESTGANRDRPRDWTPPPSKLEAVELKLADM